MTPEPDGFPDSPRVIYERRPLTEVICQLRFPPLLRIEGEPPADFQERIRTLFPLLERSRPAVPQLPPQIAQMIGATVGGTEYIFRTENGQNTLRLSPDAISLTTTNYMRWESFWGLLNPPLVALAQIYKPSFFVRIGLRYQNAIRRELIGLKGRPWSELLCSALLGELTIFERDVEEATKAVRIRVREDDSGILIQHGLGIVEGSSEKAYLIDLDLYTNQKTGLGDAELILSRFHRRAGKVFRWCLRPDLHNAVGPRPIDDAEDVQVRHVG